MHAASVGKDRFDDTSPGASDWLFAMPGDPMTTMWNRCFMTCLAVRLLCPLAADGALCQVTSLASSSPCGAPMDCRGWHALGCGRASMNSRHDRWVELWTRAAREAGAHARSEQLATEIGLAEQPPKVRSDIRIEALESPWPLHLDVLVKNTAHCHEGEWRVLGRGCLVHTAEDDTLTEWNLPAQAEGRLRPITAETQGRWGPAAVATLRSLAVRSNLDRPWSFGPFLRRWRQRLSVALQLGVARGIFQGCGGGWPHRPERSPCSGAR